jgi:hypothetical protein
MLALLLFLILALAHSTVAAARCQVSNVSSSVPPQAAPAQRIKSTTTVSGSCVSDGEDYYSVRVDLIDAPSGLFVSSNSTAIGYNATSFTVIVENTAMTPSNNGTWHLIINVYVIRAGGTAGSFLLDYKTTSNATIQVGAPAPVPELPFAQGFSIAVGSFLAVLASRRRNKTFGRRGPEVARM